MGAFIGWELIHKWSYPNQQSKVFSRIRITEAVWKILPAYDRSTPTGVYEGKVWKER